MSTPGIKHKFDGFEPEVSDSELQERWEKLKPLLPQPKRRRPFWLFFFIILPGVCMPVFWLTESGKSGSDLLSTRNMALHRTKAHDMMQSRQGKTGNTLAAGQAPGGKESIGLPGASAAVKKEKNTPDLNTPAGHSAKAEGPVFSSTLQQASALLSSSAQNHQALRGRKPTSGKTGKSFRASLKTYAANSSTALNKQISQSDVRFLEPFFLYPYPVSLLPTWPSEPDLRSTRLWPAGKAPEKKKESLSDKRMELDVLAGVHFYATDTGRLRPRIYRDRPIPGLSAGAAFNYVTPKRLVLSAQLLYLGNFINQHVYSQGTLPFMKHNYSTYISPGNYRSDTVISSIWYKEQGSLSAKHALSLGLGAGYRLIQKPKFSMDVALMANVRATFYRYEYHSSFGDISIDTLRGPLVANADSAKYESLYPLDTSVFNQVQRRTGINLNINPTITLSYKLNKSMALILKTGYSMDLMSHRVRFENRPYNRKDDDLYRAIQNNLMLYIGLRINLYNPK